MIELHHTDGRTFGPWPSIPNPLIVPDVGAVHCAGLDWTARGWALRQVERPPEVDPRTLAELQADLCRAVDDAAEQTRMRYITPGIGQALTYLEKRDQALAVLQMGEAEANALASHGAAEFPTLSASVPLEAASLYAAAQLVISKYEQWAALSRVIEATRIAGKKGISDASDVASARAAYEAITWTV